MKILSREGEVQEGYHLRSLLLHQSQLFPWREHLRSPVLHFSFPFSVIKNSKQTANNINEKGQLCNISSRLTISSQFLPSTSPPIFCAFPFPVSYLLSNQIKVFFGFCVPVRYGLYYIDVILKPEQIFALVLQQIINFSIELINRKNEGKGGRRRSKGRGSLGGGNLCTLVDQTLLKRASRFASIQISTTHKITQDLCVHSIKTVAPEKCQPPTTCNVAICIFFKFQTYFESK